MTTPEPLEPCPFCACYARVMVRWDETMHHKLYSVVCVCGASGPEIDDEPFSIKEWNQRIKPTCHSPAPSPDAVRVALQDFANETPELWGDLVEDGVVRHYYREDTIHALLQALASLKPKESGRG